MPHGGGADREKLLAALADADGEAIRRMTEAVKRQQEIENLIDRVPTDVCRVVLRLRYVDLLRWSEIEKRMVKSGAYAYERRQIFRIHGLALKEARKVWEEVRGCTSASTALPGQ
jgi:hypothetical protein